MPILEDRYFVGALYNPLEGTSTRPAPPRLRGGRPQARGEIHRQTRVVELNPRSDGGWDVVTDKGTITVEHVVNAAGVMGARGRTNGRHRAAGARHGAHVHHLRGDAGGGRAEQTTGKEVPHAVDFEGEIYLRQEGKGMLMGTYERAGKPWSPDTTPWDFGPELLPDDLDRIAPSLEIGFQHFPAIGKAGIKPRRHGPFTFAPDAIRWSGPSGA